MPPSSAPIAEQGLVSLSITCDGAALPGFVQVLTVETNNSTNRIPSARITVADGDVANGDFPIADQGMFKPGTKVVISVGYDSTVTPIFTGVVVRHGVKIGDNGARLVIECRDPALAMTVGRKNANHVGQSDQQIIAALIAPYAGLSAAIDSTPVIYKELVQYYVSDWDYMLARAEANGLLVTVDGGKVTVAAPAPDAAPVLGLAYGDSLIEFDADLDARWQLASVTGTSWDPATLAVIETSALPRQLTGQGDTSSAALAEVLGAGDFGMQTSAPLDGASLEAWTASQQTRAALARIRGRMLFQGSALARPGVVLALAGVGAHFNGNVIACDVIHRIAEGNWTTEVSFGMPAYRFTEENQLQAPLASGWTAGIAGLHIGLVMKLDADPEGQYRIQVSMPLMKADPAGVWARLSTYYGSAGFGAFVIPEIGDEVILGFFNNDPSCPVILGSLYSSRHVPPYAPTAENNLKALVTRSQLKMVFDDDKKAITFITPGNNKIVISDDAASIVLQDQNDNRVELSPGGILLDSAGDITIRATGKVNIAAGQDVQVAAQMDVKVAGANIDQHAAIGFVARGEASAELSAEGPTTVKGALVLIN